MTLPMDLQLFSDGLIGDGETEDDIEEIIEEEGDDDIEELSAIFADDDEDEPEEKPEDTEPEEEQDDEPAEEQPDGKFYTQAELDALISSRVQREQAKYANFDLNSIRQLEKAAGMPVSDILEHVKGNRIQSYVDEGMDEQKAQRQVEQELQFDELQERLHHAESYMQAMSSSAQYERQKNSVINKNPLYKKFESEIDEFAGYGMTLPFEEAAKYIIGDKIARGELIDDIRKGAENKLLAGSQKRGKAKIESGSQAGGKTKGQLTSLERKAARAFGISDTEWLNSRKQIEKKNPR